jgi:hypothetical protein
MHVFLSFVIYEYLTWCKWFTHLVALGVKIDQLKHCSIVGPLEIGLGISSEA